MNSSLSIPVKYPFATNIARYLPKTFCIVNGNTQYNCTKEYVAYASNLIASFIAEHPNENEFIINEAEIELLSTCNFLKFAHGYTYYISFENFPRVQKSALYFKCPLLHEKCLFFKECHDAIQDTISKITEASFLKLVAHHSYVFMSSGLLFNLNPEIITNIFLHDEITIPKEENIVAFMLLYCKKINEPEKWPNLLSLIRCEDVEPQKWKVIVNRYSDDKSLFFPLLKRRLTFPNKDDPLPKRRFYQDITENLMSLFLNEYNLLNGGNYKQT